MYKISIVQMFYLTMQVNSITVTNINVVLIINSPLVWIRVFLFCFGKTAWEKKSDPPPEMHSNTKSLNPASPAPDKVSSGVYIQNCSEDKIKYLEKQTAEVRTGEIIKLTFSWVLSQS